MNRKIILLDRLALGATDEMYRVAFWLAVPVERRPFYADPNKTSAVKNITAEELGDLRAGQFIEVVESLNKPAGATEEQSQGMLEMSFLRRQADLNVLNPFDRYGTYWDGAAWHNMTVA